MARAQVLLRNAAFQGAAGAQGPTGATGNTGPQGPQGVTLLFGALADSAIVSNSTARTLLYGNSAQIAPGSPAGRVYRFKFGGHWDTTGGAAANLTIGLWNGTGDMVGIAFAVGANEVKRFEVELNIIVRTTGAGGTSQRWGFAIYAETLAQALGLPTGAGDAFDTTATITMNPALTWSVANANNKAWVQYFTFESIN